MTAKTPIRIFECGHERPEDVRDLLRKYIPNVPYQKVGDMGYCRTCMKDVKIIGKK